LDPSYIKPILMDHEKYDKFTFYTDKYFTNIIYVRRMFSQGLLLNYGAKWKHHRSLLGSAFLYENIVERTLIINKSTLETIAAIRKSGETEFDMMERIPNITGQVIVRSFFGDDLGNTKINGREPQVEISLLIKDGFATTFYNSFNMAKHILF
jgi:cytochrome P450